MKCSKCGSPVYHPSPSKLCPTCEGKRLDEIAKKEAAKESVEKNHDNKNIT